MKFSSNYLSASLGFILGVILTLLTLFCILWYMILDYPVPWKVLDPAHPNFKVENFKLSDYEEEEPLQRALEKMFPPGTDRSEVESVLVDIARAKARKSDKPKSPLKRSPDDQIFYYSYSNYRTVIYSLVALGVPQSEFSWKVRILYDADDNLISIYVI